MAQPNQFMFPRLELRILNSSIDPNTGNIQGKVCKDDVSWKKGDKVCSDYSIGGYDCSDVGDNGVKASEACKVACNSCPVDIKIKRDINRTYNRLPSPVEEINDPWASNIIQTDGEWKPGEMHDISRNPEFFDKIDELEDKIDNIRKSMPDVKCLCSDITDKSESGDKNKDKDTKHTQLKPFRCGNVSELFEWDGIETHTSQDSKDTDVRYKVKCKDGKYADEAVNKYLKEKDLVYNCTAQRWETRQTGSRKAKFTPYDFKKHGIIRCNKRCDSYTTTEDCPKDDCKFINGKCIDVSDPVAKAKADDKAKAEKKKKTTDKAASTLDPLEKRAGISGTGAISGVTGTQESIDKNYDTYKTALHKELKELIKAAGNYEEIRIINIRQGSLIFDFIIFLENDTTVSEYLKNIDGMSPKESKIKHIHTLDGLTNDNGEKLKQDDPLNFKFQDFGIHQPMNIADHPWALLAIYGFISAGAVVMSILSSDKHVWGLKVAFLVTLPLLYGLMMYINKETKRDDIRRKLMWVFGGVVICIMYALISGQKLKSKAFSQYQGKAKGMLKHFGSINPMTVITTTVGIGTSITGLLGIL